MGTRGTYYEMVLRQMASDEHRAELVN
jgi:hypothetical protein